MIGWILRRRRADDAAAPTNEQSRRLVGELLERYGVKLTDAELLPLVAQHSALERIDLARLPAAQARHVAVYMNSLRSIVTIGVEANRLKEPPQ